MNHKVAIIMGSTSDKTVMADASKALEEFGVSYDLHVVSAHRTPEEMMDFALKAKANGYSVIIAGAGGAAHLPGMVASLTTLPVIGVPVNVTSLEGVDALLSIVQMPKGVPVATMAVDNSYNAGLLAIRILALVDSQLETQLLKFREKQKQKVHLMNKDLKG